HDDEPDTVERDFILVSDHASDRLRVPLVSICAKHPPLSTRLDAGLDLFDRGVIMLAKHLCLHRILEGHALSRPLYLRAAAPKVESILLSCRAQPRHL